ncbi:hypothetical protein CJ739_353 [Mariniflexile rhizosphaerae]|uniref:DUF3307 domain-containing protein n=1 Tax=unclassified Mariniflexile TaxID=2643887 RepID=UPI000CAEE3B3|nr:DUF3307 domain-containing protein [Mariniflexile sp. TRM1-10]AXP79451.1 hypothetical protein CJ739_353 [Mariniflexile sp. TRM1-10]PLB19405.1 MAG: DUF3307 domain containing protein [Flavobacteriaceae bacterium FS1-H7996/R]
MIVLIKLLLAHIIGDFFLQPKKWVKEKEQKKLKSDKLYLHVLIHVVLTGIFLWDISLWPIVVTIGITHLIIDATKLLIQKKKTKRLFFFIDQLLHIIVIFLCYYLYTESLFNLNDIVTENSLLLLVCLLFLTVPVSIIMKIIFAKWNIEKLTKDNQSLEDAGKYIGILERILVFIFIIFNHWEAVGFLITAKSVFRFGDLKKSKHRKLTEYILIGTLISFGIAIITGIIYTYIITHV